MADLKRFVQSQPKQLAGAGAILGATSVIIQDFVGIDGVALTMSDFGAKGYGTIEPGSGTQEEQISFTGVTPNGNGTSTLTGVKSVGFVYPYTETTGLIKTHAGGTVFVISNTAAFYEGFLAVDNDQTITGIWTFTNPNVPRMDVQPAYGVGTELYFATKQYVDDVAFNGAPDASTTQKGIAQQATLAQTLAGTEFGSTLAPLFVNPSSYTARNYYGYAADVGASDTYVITLSPVPPAYVDGMVIQFKAATVNTGACTLNVNGLGAKSLKMNKNLDPVDGYIKAGQSVTVVYDGTNFEILSVSGKPQISQSGEEIYGTDAVGTDDYAITLSPIPPAYVLGMTVRFKAGTANTGACTLNVNGLGATAIKKSVSSDLVTGDILANQITEVIYDGTNFQIISAVPFGSKVQVVSTAVTVANTATETNLISVAIPGGTLSTNNAVRARLYIQSTQTTGGITTTLRFKYGGTTLTTMGATVLANGVRGLIEFILVATGATGTQKGMDLIDLNADAASPGTGNFTFNTYDTGTSAVDSTASQNLVVTVQFSSADPSANIVMYLATIEKIT